MGVRTYKDLPEEVQDYLFGEEVISAYDKVIAAHGLSPQADTSLARAVDDVLLGRIELLKLPTRLASEFNVDETKAKKMACDVAGHVLTPIAGVVGDIDAAVKTWCEKPEQFKDIPKIQIKEKNQADVMAKALAEAGVSVADPTLQHRLGLILSSYTSGVRTEEAALQALMRPTKVGGMAMAEDAARQVLSLVQGQEIAVPPAVQDSAPTPPSPAPVVEPKSEPVQPPTPAPQPEPAPEPQTKPALPLEPMGDLISGEDAAELEKHASRMQELNGATPPISLADAVAQVMRSAGLVLDDERFVKRLQMIVEARLKGIRDAYETRTLLETPLEKGGAGFEGKQLVTVMEAIESAYTAYHKIFEVEKQKEKEAMLLRKREGEEVRRDELRAQEQDLLGRRYTEMTGRSPESLPAPDPLQHTPEPVDTAAMKQAIAASMSASTLPPSGGPRPRMDDVRFVRRLAGPVEELSSMALVDFRRLSRDPKEAITKIKDKVALLEDQGYEKRIAGIKGWRQSPINQLYLTLSQEALLTGKHINAILAEKRAAGQDTLTEQEVEAIMHLNGELRF